MVFVVRLVLYCKLSLQENNSLASRTLFQKSNLTAQFSTLGPLLILLHINDLYYSTNILSRLFADDTCLIINSRNEKLLKIEINKNLSINVFNWYCANKLNLNPKKSNYIIISTKSNVEPPLDFPNFERRYNLSTH